MPSERLYYDLALKWKGIMYTERHVSRAMGHKFDIRDAKYSSLEKWQKFHIFLQKKKKSQVFIRPKKGRHLQVDEAVLCFASDIQAKDLPISCRTMQLKAGEIAKSFRTETIKFKAIRGWCDPFRCRAWPLLT